MHTRDTLNRMAQEDGIAATELLERLVRRETQERLLAAMNDDFARLRSDATAWREFKEETAAWDATSAQP